MMSCPGEAFAVRQLQTLSMLFIFAGYTSTPIDDNTIKRCLSQPQICFVFLSQIIFIFSYGDVCSIM